jgi:sugar/nucleoside kinase (ribokinase family)
LVRPFVEHCDLLLAGQAELEEVLGDEVRGADVRAAEGRGQTTAEALARAAAALGPREVVVRGATSIGVLAHGSWTTLDIRRDDAVDPIGAGDAFNAGYIAVRLRDGSPEEALRAGARCGAAVTRSVSDTAAFPRNQEHDQS